MEEKDSQEKIANDIMQGKRPFNEEASLELCGLTAPCITRAVDGMGEKKETSTTYDQMDVLGYINPNGYYPSYLLVVLKSSEGDVYVSWPKACIFKAIGSSEEYIAAMRRDFVPEKKKLNIPVNKITPTDKNIFIAFSQRIDDEVRLLPVCQMYEHLANLLAANVLNEREKRIVLEMHETFWR
jgi:hypothetical protein